MYWMINGTVDSTWCCSSLVYLFYIGLLVDVADPLIQDCDSVFGSRHTSNNKAVYLSSE